MTDREKQALRNFAAGYNCAQSMFMAYADLLGLTQEQAARLSAGFGGGIGRLRQNCGAFSAAVMLCGALTPEGGKPENRPEVYRRQLSVQQFWSGGDGTVETTVTVKAPWTRAGRTLADGRVRHTLTDGETTYIWYDRETAVYTAPAGDITADVEQSIPTYEDILDLPAARIAAADYQVISGVNCIYVETTADDAGYVLRYWVSLDSGLLVAAEKLLEEETIYRMWQTSEEFSPVIDREFTLPDGTDVLVDKN